MDRSLYPEGVEVHQVDLARTETTKRFHILQRQLEITQTGIASGFVVSANTGDNTLIDIATGDGYAPNGEFVESTTLQTGLQLSDYAATIINFVLAVYVEVNGDPQSHETNGESPNTSATRGIRFVVLTRAEYEALPITDDNLSNNSQDRSLIVARVTGQGVGLSIAGAIVNAPTFGSPARATIATPTITGLTITDVDSRTIPGNGTLDFVTATSLITWQPPDETNPGNPVNLTADGTYVLSGLSGKTLTVVIVFASLPGTDETDIVVVENIYGQTVQRNSVVDIDHRGRLGSAPVISTANPHGQTTKDFGIGDFVGFGDTDPFTQRGTVHLYDSTGNPDLLFEDATVASGAVGRTFRIENDGGTLNINASETDLSSEETIIEIGSLSTTDIVTLNKGLSATGTTNVVGVEGQGGANNSGVKGTGGSSGIGVEGIGGTSETGVKGTGSSFFPGVTGVGGADAVGVQGTGGATNAEGVEGFGTGTNAGVKGTGGNNDGPGIQGVGGTGPGGGDGVIGNGGTNNGNGVTGNAAGTGNGVEGNAANNSGSAGVVGSGGTVGASRGVEGFGGSAGGEGVYGESSTNSAAVRGENSGGSSSSAGTFVNNGDGYGLICEADTSSPIHSAFRIVPQDAQPTGNNFRGDIYVDNSGILWICTATGTPGTWVKVGTQT